MTHTEVGILSTIDVVNPASLAHRADAVAMRQGSPSTRRTYRTAYRSLAAFLGPTTAKALTAEDVARWALALETAGKKPRSIAVYLSAVRTLARELGGDPAIQTVRAPRTRPGRPRDLEPEEVARLLRMPDRRTRIGRRDAAVLALLVGAGLRRHEAANLRLEDLEERRRYRDPRVRTAVAGSTPLAVVIYGKRGRERTVPLATFVVDALRSWIEHRPTAPTTHVFLTLPRRAGDPSPLDPRDVGRIVERHASTAGLPDHLRGPHVLRHTFATTLRRQGVELDVIRDLLGHDDVRTTQVYAAVDRADLEAAIDHQNPATAALDLLGS